VYLTVHLGKHLFMFTAHLGGNVLHYLRRVLTQIKFEIIKMKVIALRNFYNVVLVFIIIIIINYIY
jgi:hypothetical protein